MWITVVASHIAFRRYVQGGGDIKDLAHHSPLFLSAPVVALITLAIPLYRGGIRPCPECRDLARLLPAEAQTGRTPP
ncbi:hypothetical protein [Ancrocorticia populi]|uniref:hypothetical protein n=1 Tax=Ancrocorticia populi TaxID=2175228 RepID=UPI003F8EFAFD